MRFGRRLHSMSTSSQATFFIILFFSVSLLGTRFLSGWLSELWPLIAAFALAILRMAIFGKNGRPPREH
ncbi:hypothetical protein FF36_06331 [Frankia torreyi]|uniref:Uncharacterized protein n=1 Tax=Frankia torreyi TaxID=1856 RepID=A0A0D8B522_9ACTN|nr:hypothetical protein FF36_06331 [Frankia torreyi]KQM02192.1 hypothetical protein FF86_107717 [Frankia sp. CpI1-P]